MSERDGFVQDQFARQNAALAILAESVAEVRRPPARFLVAQDLFQAGRYADAEALYGALLIERSASALTAPILVNSALANAMLGNCTMVKGRPNQLKIAAPRDPLLARVPVLAKECGLRRSVDRRPA